MTLETGIAQLAGLARQSSEKAAKERGVPLHRVLAAHVTALRAAADLLEAEALKVRLAELEGR